MLALYARSFGVGQSAIGLAIAVYGLARFLVAAPAGRRIRRVLTDDKPHVERVTCRKVTAELAETRSMIYARRWVDLNGYLGSI